MLSRFHSCVGKDGRLGNGSEADIRSPILCMALLEICERPIFTVQRSILRKSDMTYIDLISTQVEEKLVNLRTVA